MPRPFWIDTDTASDDAVALIMALRHPAVRVHGISVVAGNVALAKAARNALYVAELCQSTVPVYAGAARPLLRETAHAEWFHGSDGLGDRGFPPPARSLDATPAVEALVAAARQTPGLTLVTLGPLTNIAQAIRKDPAFAPRIARLVIMGGAACTEGNVTPAAEFNIWCDPEAADIVFRAPWPQPPEMVGWELSRFAAVCAAPDIAALRALHTPLADFAVDANTVAIEAYHAQTGERGISLPDPVAMAVALDPSLCTRRSTHATLVECASPLTRGMTVVDRLGVAADPRNRALWHDAGRLSICWAIDIPRFKRLVLAACS